MPQLAAGLAQWPRSPGDSAATILLQRGQHHGLEHPSSDFIDAMFPSPDSTMGFIQHLHL